MAVLGMAATATTPQLMRFCKRRRWGERGVSGPDDKVNRLTFNFVHEVIPRHLAANGPETPDNPCQVLAETSRDSFVRRFRPYGVGGIVPLPRALAASSTHR
jgi:hypothetical protein